MGRPRHAQRDRAQRHPSCRHRPTMAVRRARHPMIAERWMHDSAVASAMARWRADGKLVRWLPSFATRKSAPRPIGCNLRGSGAGRVAFRRLRRECSCPRSPGASKKRASDPPSLRIHANAAAVGWKTISGSTHARRLRLPTAYPVRTSFLSRSARLMGSAVQKTSSRERPAHSTVEGVAQQIPAEQRQPVPTAELRPAKPAPHIDRIEQATRSRRRAVRRRWHGANRLAK
jgi:hypothetical protein